MQSPKRHIVALALLACLSSGPSAALVGASSEGGPMASHVLMVLTSGAAGSGFCTGVVIAPDAILTAAHCVATLKSTRVMIRTEEALAFLEPAAITKHPGYRAQAVRNRERSIDLAMIKLSTLLPAALKPVTFDDRAPQIGSNYGIAGFGVTRESAGSSSGMLRWGELRTRAPLSSILLWAEDGRGQGFGACEGDSGGPIFALDTNALLAITSWSEGEGKARCGKLTQAALIAPQRNWIEQVLKGWSGKR